MAKALSKTGIVDGQLATAAQVTQSIDAFTAASDYDIEISGSLGVTGPLSVTGSTDLDGNLAIPGFPNVSASLAASGVGNGFPFTGSAAISGSLSIDGPNGTITASGVISASGDIIGNRLYAQGGTIWTVNTQSLRNVSNGLVVGGAPQWEQVTLGRVGTPTIINGAITASSNISASGDLRADTLRVGVTSDNTSGLFISASSFDGDTRDAQIIYPNHGLEFNNQYYNYVLALADNNVGIRRQPASSNNALEVSGSIQVIDGNISASGDISSSANIYAVDTNISNPRGDGFMAGNPVYTSRDIVFLTHQDFHYVDLATAGSPLDNMSAQRVPTLAQNLFVNGALTDHRYASFVIPCGFKVSKVGVLGSSGTFTVRAAGVATDTTQDCIAEGGYVSVTTSPPADTFNGYLGIATDLGGEAAIVPSASNAGGYGNYINIDVSGSFAIYGGVIVLDRI